jgi:alpha-methylacyl-CoA racemase
MTMAKPQRAGPLTGVRVLELVQKGPAAYVTMMLADMGADVIKVEAPLTVRDAGSSASAGESDVRAQAAAIVNRGKRSLELDLKTPRGQKVIGALAAKIDVVVEGFRPGVTKRLGADYETLRAINPRLIYCSLSGYGQDGPYRDLAGHDLNYLATSGILNLIGEKGKPPVIPLNFVADYGGASLHAIAGITMALYARERTGKGQLVDISYLDATVSLLAPTRFVQDYLDSGAELQRGSGVLSGVFPYYAVYETRDGKYISVGCIEPWLWENFCKAIGRPDMIDAALKEGDFGSDPTERQRACKVELERIMKTRDRDDWFSLLSGADACVGKVNDLNEIFDDPQLQHRGMVPRVAHPTLGEVPQIGIGIKLSETPGEIRGFAPWRGQHTREILDELGLD